MNEKWRILKWLQTMGRLNYIDLWVATTFGVRRDIQRWPDRWYWPILKCILPLALAMFTTYASICGFLKGGMAMLWGGMEILLTVVAGLWAYSFIKSYLLLEVYAQNPEEESSGDPAKE